MTVTWNLTHVMYDRGVFSVTELRNLMHDKGNLDISVPAVYRLVNSLPQEIKFTTLEALCTALECGVNDLIVYEQPTLANKDVQPLVLDSSFKPPKRKKKIVEKKAVINSLPPI